MGAALDRHWPEYLAEALGLALFMLSASVFASALFHPASPVAVAGTGAAQRVWMGVAMGATAIGLIYSPWGQRSGAHLNPAVTLTFLRLGKIAPWDALFYVLAQFTGAVGGMLLARAVLGEVLAHAAVAYVTTVPGPSGRIVAFAAEAALAFGMMTLVLTVSNSTRVARLTGVFAGALVAVYITLEAPVSGTSMNPARTTGSAVVAWVWAGWWIYVAAPTLAMLAAAELHRWRRAPVRCAKLDHAAGRRCIFRCEYAARATAFPPGAR